MALKTSYEPPINGLHGNIISFGSFERDGSYPYVYNNQQEAIILVDLDKDFNETPNNNIVSYKDVIYKNDRITVPIIRNGT